MTLWSDGYAELSEGVVFRLADCEPSSDAGHCEDGLDVLGESDKYERSVVRKLLATRDKRANARTADVFQVSAIQYNFVLSGSDQRFYSTLEFRRGGQVEASAQMQNL